MRRPRGSAAAAAALIAASSTAACRLTDTVLATPEDVVVVEIYLVAGSFSQTAFLHDTRGDGLPPGDPAGAVPHASIRILDADGAVVVELHAASDAAACLYPDSSAYGSAGTCYVAATPDTAIRPGSSYALDLRLADGRRLAGTTTVPGDFRLRHPDRGRCTLEPETRLDMAWTPAQGAWAYVATTHIHGLAQALDTLDVEVPDPLELQGLAISRTDTTIVFPTEFGLFDRFNLDNEILVALQDGLPPGTSSGVQIAAIDRNYANWVRGGRFNPSGQVRVPSVHGDGGTGVFGSLVARSLLIDTDSPASSPPCS